LCTHNGELYIEEQLRSILAQTVKPYEVVVSDDASTDRTLEIVDYVWRALPDAPRLVVLPNKTALGVTAHFEQAVSACEGDLIALSDQDDVWVPGRLEAVIAKFESRPGLELLFSDARLVTETGKPLGASLFEALEISAADLEAMRSGDAFATLLRRNLVTGATTVFRRSLLEDAAPFESDWVHDEWLAIIAAARGEIDWIPEQLIDYRQHGANQIGVVAPTVRYKVSRVLEPRGDRNEKLAIRATALLGRLEAMQADARLIELARGKLAHEAFRAALPSNRALRLWPVLRAARTGGYRRFCSRGRVDILRDLLQPARQT
jgi:glycosyltransferase involved in cell wall biosynthesis